MNIRELDRRAMTVTAVVIPLITAEQLDNPTPCERWLVRDLLAHIIGQYHGFAAAASGQPTSLEAFRPHGVTAADLVPVYTEATALITDAFADHCVPDRRFHLPEIRDGGPYPATTAIGFHLVDEVVHAWDLAKSTGVPVDFDDEVLDAAQSIARQVPNIPASRGEGFAFARGVETDPGVATLDRIVALLGRRPDWIPTTAR